MHEKKYILKLMKTIPEFEKIFSFESIFDGWLEFQKGKRKKLDVLEFKNNLISNLAELHGDLRRGEYKHGGYRHFKISDPKPRNIHKASVRDRVLHHVLYKALYPYFNNLFIQDSYSCRIDKGTHRALNRFNQLARKESLGGKQTVWILKCDIRKCFASIDHEILKSILKKHVKCDRTLKVILEVIDSFETSSGKGIPLGNLTSQLLVNIYMNELDQFVKRKLKVERYIRYTDDFVIFHQDKNHLNQIVRYIVLFLDNELRLTLHPNKVHIKTLSSGVDFLGWTHFSHHRVLRTTTKRRMLKNLADNLSVETRVSYLGMLKWGNTQKLWKMIG